MSGDYVEPTLKERLSVQKDEWRSLKNKTIQELSSTTDNEGIVWMTLHFTDGTHLNVGSTGGELWWDSGDGEIGVYPEYEHEWPEDSEDA